MPLTATLFARIAMTLLAAGKLAQTPDKSLIHITNTLPTEYKPRP